MARSKKKSKSVSSKAKKKVARAKKPVKAAARKAKAAARPKKAAAKAKKPAPKPAKKPAPKAKAAAKAPKAELAPAVTRALEQAEVEGLISRLPPPVQPVVKTLRALVLEVAPEASEQIENGAAAYFANGVFARIEPGEHEVLVRFLKGGQLPSAGELSGEGETRALTFKNVEELKETVLRKVVREAVMLNLSSSGAPTAQA
ncbi:MAG: DUF1801 domain-containing protein [Myxococcaceae bacterium]